VRIAFVPSCPDAGLFGAIATLASACWAMTDGANAKGLRIKQTLNTTG
jgi:hypothetical protein